MFESQKGAAEASPAVNTKLLRKRRENSKSPMARKEKIKSPMVQAAKPSSVADSTVNELPRTPNLKDSASPIPSGGASNVYEGPLLGEPSRKPPTRKNSIRDKLALFEKRNKELKESASRYPISARSADSGKVARRNSRVKRLTRQDSDPTLGDKAEYSPLGGRSTDPAPYATPAGYRIKMSTEMSREAPRAPTLDEDDDDDEKQPESLRPESLDPVPNLAKKSYKVKREIPIEEVKRMEEGPSLQGFNRPDTFDSPTPSKRSWKPKVLSLPTRPDGVSSSDCKEASENHGRGISPQNKALPMPEDMDDTSTDSDDSSYQRNNLHKTQLEIPLETEIGELPEAPVIRKSWKPKRVISIEEMEAMHSASGDTVDDEANDSQCPEQDDAEGAIHEMPLKTEPSEFPDAPVRRKSWKPKRVISLEEMEAMQTTSPGPVRSQSQGSKRTITWKPEADKKVADTKFSDTKGGDDDSVKTNDSEKSPNSSNSKKSSKLQDRINMFNNFSSSPEPQRAFLSSRFMNKLVQKNEEKEGSHVNHLKALVEDKPSILDAPPLATPNSTETSSKGELDVSSHRMSLDKAVAETRKKQVEKQRSMSIMRRGQLKSTRSALVGQKDKDKNAVFANVLVRQEDFPSHVLPEFAKDPADKKIILTALRKKFVFDEKEEEAMDKLVAAMEQIKVSKGEEIMKQGSEGDYFYVVARGEVGLFVDRRKVATAGPANAFGEIALLYSCPQAATVVAREDPTTLFRVDQQSFRFIMQSETKKSEEEKKQMLQQVPFLSSLGAEDIARLCSVMTPVLFYTGDYIVQRGEKGSSFYMIQDGKVRVTEIFVGGTSYEDIVLEKGDYFGEDALISEEPRAANVVALTTGRAFSIDRENVRKVLGDFASLISKAQDRQRLESMKIFRDADLNSADFDNLSKLITDQKFSQNEIIFEHNCEVDAALYIVREGAVKIKYSDKQEEVIGVGGAFGQDQLLADSKGDATSDCKVAATYTATAISDCVCGILTLEDCRNTFDTNTLGDRIFSGGNSALEQKRAAMRELMKANVKLEDLDKDRIIGEGQFGTVWLVRADPHQTNDKSKMLEFAMKVQFKDDPVRRDGAIEAIKREMTVIHQLNHPFIIDLVDKYETEDQLMMLTEPVKGGELWSRIHREGEDGNWTSGMPESDAKFYALVVADTVAYMHRQKIIFRDLKPENVLIDAEGYPTLCDFGFAKYCPDKTYTFCGTPNYLAPEIVLNRGHGAAVDHWALGIVAYEMITGENPFYYEGQDQMSLLQAIVQEAYYPLPDTVSKEVVDFMSAILEKDPVQRLGSLAGGEKGILKHEWFSDLDINQIRNKKAKAPFVPGTGGN